MKSAKQEPEERKMPLCPHCEKPVTPFYASNDKGFPTEMGLVCKSEGCTQEDGTPYRFSFKIG